ncbi:hypothetical protein O181_021177 [Austropuccinia psidii MF-1]|uniref:Lariat debranching enzyme C-terminal domain-containing protein n=1 Tax=Austropuccinia psidii MF-1 TaxID=1389203 RepID=A0A9Q3CD40_9BASI|nr:hypothetical protein [Austropuccinia psidii MF-1]
MKVAIEGCCHGELDNIYHTIDLAIVQAGIEPPDVLICCGDFQSFRNHADLHTFAAPHKYRQLGCFWKYYSGQKVAPILTIFVGGNHEASGYLWELYHGGWVAPNIYFLGFAGSVILKKTLPDGSTDSIRISGASGIYKKHDYCTGHYERIPFDQGTIRSIYHIREYDIFRLSKLPVSTNDIFVSHDWPVGIEQYGNTAQLLRVKPFFRDEVTTNTLGSPPLMHLLKTIKPSYWFSAHLHVKFAALYHHDRQSDSLPLNQPEGAVTKVDNPDELQVDIEDDEPETCPLTTSIDRRLIRNPDIIEIDDSDEDTGPNEPRTAPLRILSTFDQTYNSQGTHASHMERQKLVVPSTIQENDTAVNTLDINIDVPDMQSPLEQSTRFLALDKCLPHRDFLQILDIPCKSMLSSTVSKCTSNVTVDLEAPGLASPDVVATENSPAQIADTNGSTARLFFDPHWLAITRAFHDYLPLSKHHNKVLPTDPLLSKKMVDKELEWVKNNLKPETLEIGCVQTFVKTAPGIDDLGGEHAGQLLWYTNPQTLAFTHFLQINNKINAASG